MYKTYYKLTTTWQDLYKLIFNVKQISLPTVIDIYSKKLSKSPQFTQLKRDIFYVMLIHYAEDLKQLNEKFIKLRKNIESKNNI
jgi:hypothetical protein